MISKTFALFFDTNAENSFYIFRPVFINYIITYLPTLLIYMPLKTKFLALLLSLLFLNACTLETKTAPKAKPDQTHTITKKITVTPKVIVPKVVEIKTVKAELVIPVAAVKPEPEYHDAWWEIKQSNKLAMPDIKRFQSHLNWFSKHQDYLNRVTQRAEPYLYYIIESLKKENMPLELALLPIVESGYQSFAYSHGRAAGMWQFIPSTGKLYGLKQDWWYDGRRDAIRSSKAAIKLLKDLGKHYNGDWLLALAAYNWGPGNVDRAIGNNKKSNKGTTFWDLKLPKETKNYVPKLLALKELINYPEKYNITWRSIPYQPSVQLVKIKTQIDLAVVAKLADVPIETVYRYNSALNRWATPPKGPHDILLPIASAKKLQANLKKTPKKQLITWKRHKIKNGETLGHIARKYHTTVAQIRSLNNIHKTNIRAGKHIIVPIAGKKLKTYSLSEQQRLSSIKSTPRSGKKISVKVKKGDSFWDLAQKYKVSVRQVAKWNGLAPRDQLKIGQKLVIWATKPTSMRQTLLGNPHLRNIKTIRTINYKIRSGDSLARIADKFNVRVSNLRKWNKKTTSKKYIQPGQKLRLYIDVRKQSG
jgi:membrane-bound lytic murein transglycosylase D